MLAERLGDAASVAETAGPESDLSEAKCTAAGVSFVDETSSSDRAMLAGDAGLLFAVLSSAERKIGAAALSVRGYVVTLPGGEAGFPERLADAGPGADPDRSKGGA